MGSTLKVCRFVCAFLGILLFAGFILPQPALADTSVSGHITEDTTWTLAGSPYIVTGDITVRHSGCDVSQPATLTIEPGVEVRFSQGSGLFVGAWIGDCGYHYGALDAQGTVGQPVVFTSDAPTPAPGDWKGIVFQLQTIDESTILSHCIVEYGGHTEGANIRFNSSSPTVNSTIIRHSSKNGIYLHYASPIVTNNTITDNAENGIYLHISSNPLIGGEGEGNTISNTGSYPIYCVDNTSRPEITYNTI